MKLCCISPSSVLIRSDVFKNIGVFDEKLPVCEDYDLWLRITANEEVLFVDEPLIKKFGGHSDQLSKKFWGLDRFRVYSIEKLINFFSIKVNSSKKVKVVLEISESLMINTNGYLYVKDNLEIKIDSTVWNIPII